MQRALRTNRWKRGVRGQAIYIFMLGLAVVAMILTNVFLFLEYFEYYHGRDSAAGQIRSMAESPTAPAPTPEPSGATEGEPETPAAPETPAEGAGEAGTAAPANE